jgi:hypothetical protein
MAAIQDFSSRLIDYAERLSEMADAAEGKHRLRPTRTTRWLLLPASGAAVYALLRSDSFSRQAKGVVDEAKARASDLPDELLSRVRQSSGTSNRNGSRAARSSTTRRKSTTSRRTSSGKTTASSR